MKTLLGMFVLGSAFLYRAIANRKGCKNTPFTRVLYWLVRQRIPIKPRAQQDEADGGQDDEQKGIGFLGGHELILLIHVWSFTFPEQVPSKNPVQYLLQQPQNIQCRL